MFISSYKNIEVITSVKNPQGKAALVLPKRYTMGFSGFKVKKYDQTLALKNADLPYEDEKFSYIAISKEKCDNSGLRILRHPMIEKGKVTSALRAHDKGLARRGP